MNIKYCPGCKNNKLISEFRPNRKRIDGLQGYCEICDKQKQAAYYQKNKKSLQHKRRFQRTAIKRDLQTKVWDYFLSHPCVDCGETDRRVLEFDHRDRTNKTAGVGYLCGQGFSWKTVLAEIEKCDVRCVKCHRIKTFTQMGWKTWLVGGT